MNDVATLNKIDHSLYLDVLLLYAIAVPVSSTMQSISGAAENLLRSFHISKLKFDEEELTKQKQAMISHLQHSYNEIEGLKTSYIDSSTLEQLNIRLEILIMKKKNERSGQQNGIGFSSPCHLSN